MISVNNCIMFPQGIVSQLKNRLFQKPASELKGTRARNESEAMGTCLESDTKKSETTEPETNVAEPAQTIDGIGKRSRSRNSSLCTKFQQVMRQTALSKNFFYTTSLIIIINTICLASSQSKYSDDVKNGLETVNIICNIYYVLEILIKICGHGIAYFWEVKTRLLEVLVILWSVIDIVFNRIGGTYSIGISVMRTMSLLRLLKGTKAGSSLIKIQASFIRSSRSILSLLVVLLLIMFIYAMLGNDLFKNYSEASDDKVGSFATATDSMLLVFVLLTGEGWPGVMAELVNKFWKKNKAGTILPVTYFLSFIILGNFILLNIFLGIMIDNLITESEEELRDETDNEDDFCKCPKDRPYTGEIVENEQISIELQDKEAPVFFETPSTSKVNEWGETETSPSSRKQITFSTAIENPRPVERRKSRGIPQHNSLYIFSPTNKFRMICFNIVRSDIFQHLCIGSIIISTILLAFEDPLNRDKQIAKGLHYCDFLFTGM